MRILTGSIHVGRFGATYISCKTKDCHNYSKTACVFGDSVHARSLGSVFWSK